MLIFALLFAVLGGLGVYIGLDRVDLSLGRFNEFGVSHYGWGLALNAFALAAFFAYLWRDRHRRRT